MNPDFDTLIAEFEPRYAREESFREIVHQYLDLSALERIQLGVSKALDTAGYEDIARRLVHRYTARVMADLERAQRLESERTQLAEKQQALDEAQKSYEQSKTEHESIPDSNDDPAIEARGEAVLVSKLKQQLEWSGLVNTTDEGYAFDDQTLVRALEKRFLDEVLSELENEDGMFGFFGKTKRLYEGTVSDWGAMEDMSELPYTDWLRSTIHARSLGYHRPVYPHLVTGKMTEERGRATVDTAISLDNSTSMYFHGRFEAAKKTCLALFALMSRLNPNNKTLLSYFATDLKEITTAYLARHLKPDGQTRTDLALKWLLRVTEDSDQAIAYLVTDGSPFGPRGIRKTCEQTAREFQARPHVFLRIFLVDGTKNAEHTIRQIGRAAGPTTKVMTIDSDQLAKGLITDVAAALGDMQTIEDF